MNAQASTPAANTVARTMLRVVIGFLFAAHGFQKYVQYTIEGTAAAFTQMGVPAAGLVAPIQATLEVVGGIALILGLATRVFGYLLAITMVGAIFMVHLAGGIFVENGGLELVAALGAGALAIALVGAGRFSLDHVIEGLRGSRSDRGLVKA